MSPRTTREEREEWDKMLAKVAVVAVKIDDVYADGEPGDPRPEISCPDCGTPLNYFKAISINNHRHAQCSKCGWGFHE
jgi:rubredoxin